MIVTYIKGKYVDSAGRIATVTEYGKDFVNCKHDFKDTGRRGQTQGGNGKLVSAEAHQCAGCGIFNIVEVNTRGR